MKVKDKIDKIMDGGSQDQLCCIAASPETHLRLMHVQESIDQTFIRILLIAPMIQFNSTDLE